MTGLLATLAALAWPTFRLEWIAADQMNTMRSVWLLVLIAAGGVVAALAADPWLTAMACWFVLFWRGEPQTEAAGTWAGIAATWYLARAIPAWGWAWLAVGWQLVGLLLLVACLRDRWQGQRVHGWLGQRTVVGAYFALVMALGTPWLWPAFALGLWLSGPSWLAVLAFGAGAAWRWPWWTAVIGGPVLAVGLAALLVGRRSRRTLVERWTSRGDSFDSVRLRWQTWRLGWWLFWQPGIWTRGTRGQVAGYGAGPWLRWLSLRVVGQPTVDSFHCEPLQHAVEYGLLGVVAVGLFAWRVGSGLVVGDPWSAAVLCGAVLAGGTIFCRVGPVALVWLVACAGVAR